MPERFIDSRPLNQRPEHWNYGCAAKFHFLQEDWIAMSELGIGPDDVKQNSNGHVYSVRLPGRTFSYEKLKNLKRFISLSSADLSSAILTPDTIKRVRHWDREFEVYFGYLKSELDAMG